MSTVKTPGARMFVTGGSGFVGRELISALVSRGDEVRALCRSKEAAAVVRERGALPVMGDLDDEPSLREGMTGCSAVFHAAAYVRLWGKLEDVMRVNVLGTEHALVAARGASVPRFVHVSSEAVLADGHPIIRADETWPLPSKPIGVYPLTKGLAEKRVLAEDGPEMTTVIVRPRFIWGRGDTSLLPNLVQAVKRGQLVWINGARHRTSTCHVRNVCEGTLLAAERGRGGQIYFLTDGEPVEMRAFVTALLRSQGVEPSTRELPGFLARAAAAASETAFRVLPLKGEPPVNRTVLNLLFSEVTVSDAKARRELGYASKVSVAEGLAELGAPAL